MRETHPHILKNKKKNLYLSINLDEGKKTRKFNKYIKMRTGNKQKKKMNGAKQKNKNRSK